MPNFALQLWTLTDTMQVTFPTTGRVETSITPHIIAEIEEQAEQNMGISPKKEQKGQDGM